MLSYSYYCSMLKIIKYLLIAVGVVACGADFMPSPVKQPVEDVQELPPPIPDTFTLLDIPIYDPLADFTDEYKDECLTKVFLRCPPYTEYWIAEAWMDVCEGNAIIDIANCKWKHDCDPLDPMIVNDQPCQMPDGGPGILDVYCDKGTVQITDCSPCTEEVCDGVDNDCDGEIDEGDFTCQTECGTGPAYCVDGVLICEAEGPQEEVCDWIDNDCDGEIDEGQRNACDDCGPVPEEICDTIDNDCDGETDENLLQECETVCEVGYETCVFGVWASCTAKQPWPEICNGEDDDCNGLVDDGIDCECGIQDVGILIPCMEPPLLCGQGYKSCECANEECTEFTMSECKTACSIFNLQPCDPLKGMIFSEICNNWDDNCNFLIDEDLTKACYNGPPETLDVGECIAGELTCYAGNWGTLVDMGGGQIFMEDYCDGEVIPKEELCNGKDDDCDGVIEEELTETDILFIIDLSGSMSDEIDAVISALTSFSLSYSDEPNISWGLIVGPTHDSTVYKEKIKLKTGLGPFSSFLAAVQDISNTPLNGGLEPLYDAIYLSLLNVCDPTMLEYQVSDLQWKYSMISEPALSGWHVDWREDANRVIVVFTDEMGQSFLTPPGISNTKGDAISQEIVIDSINGTEDLKVFVFSPTHTQTINSTKFLNGVWSQIPAGWLPLTMAGDVGAWYQITPDATVMFNDLMEVLEDTACSTSSE